MPDSVSSDAVDSVRATLARAGRTDRPKVTLPDDARERFPTEEVVRLDLGGKTRHVRIERALDDTLELRGAYANARQAREGDGENHLVAWADAKGLDFGRTVHVDIVDEGTAYGLRAPGERAVYTVPDAPNDSLADIAKQTEENR
ncbi:DUF7112 family protein [Halorarius litoreus]|uniref:DUF7112 family protein n=1 Tax=Halorarius litoreus TaxID=2962676 RepID=UPI0020CC8AA8|nr:hypothetical protein [Halorarius litoreus]